jgi:hypothetical protein
MAEGESNVPKISRLLSCLALAGFAIGGPAAADQVLPSLEPGAPSAQPFATTGKYGGVVPGTANKNPLPPAPADSPRLIWTGFQPTGSGSRVFLQTSQPVSYEVKEGRVSKAGKSTLTVLLRGCRIHMANNRRRIDTRAFPTPVQSFSARQRGADVELRIALREPASAAMGTEAGPDGSQFLVLDFPPGKAAPPEPPRGEAESGSDSRPPRETIDGDEAPAAGKGGEPAAKPVKPKGKARGKSGSGGGEGEGSPEIRQ